MIGIPQFLAIYALVAGLFLLTVVLRALRSWRKERRDLQKLQKGLQEMQESENIVETEDKICDVEFPLSRYWSMGTKERRELEMKIRELKRRLHLRYNPQKKSAKGAN